jgi:hypothetical protein
MILFNIGGVSVSPFYDRLMDITSDQSQKAWKESPMRIPTLVEPIPEGGFRASCGGPFDLSADGSTAIEALDQLKARVQSRLTATGSQVLDLDVPGEDHPLAPFEGMFRDNPLFHEWQQAIADYRREMDDDPSVM